MAFGICAVSTRERFRETEECNEVLARKEGEVVSHSGIR
jgi:hypothetical protein